MKVYITFYQPGGETTRCLGPFEAYRRLGDALFVRDAGQDALLAQRDPARGWILSEAYRLRVGMRAHALPCFLAESRGGVE